YEFGKDNRSTRNGGPVHPERSPQFSRVSELLSTIHTEHGGDSKTTIGLTEEGTEHHQVTGDGRGHKAV
ncbi:hypothetical protein ACUWCL_29545, partial [Klebsiella pneumoniae]|uniref:hypothetical protein n=1 Tax=Klebsiella pneumoniae TaxID=573 RepID=UPI0040558610